MIFNKVKELKKEAEFKNDECIANVLFDALTPELESYVKNECLAIIRQDIRFELIGVNIIPVPNGFTLVIRLNYLPDNLVTDLQIEFDTSKEIK